MPRKFFGTDGIRGSANSSPMTSEVALRVGMAAGKLFTNGSYRHRVVIGKDTRLSGYMIESALVSGFTAVGMDVFLLGPMPTPAVAMLTRSLRADLGVMISASHNPFADNGIKLFGPDGYKLSDETEEQVEELMLGDTTELLAAPDKIGRATRIDSARERYIEFAKRTLPKNLRFDGIRAVIDCANGAAYKVAPEALWELGADVVKLGVDPAVGPAGGRVGKDLLSLLIGDANHQVPVTISDRKNKIRLQLVTTNQPAAKFRIDAREQLGDFEGLAQVVVGAVRESLDLALEFAAGA